MLPVVKHLKTYQFKNRPVFMYVDYISDDMHILCYSADKKLV